MTREATLLRATANALWWYLQRDAWVDILETRAISPTGNPRGHTSRPAGHMPGPTLDGEALTPTVEIISRTPLIRATLYSQDWPGATAWRIILTRPDADQALSLLPAAAIAEYELALEHATCRRPFVVATDEHGGKSLTRNRNDFAITHLTAEALQAVARAATLNLIPPEVEDALLTDTDISLDLVELAVGRGALDRQDEG